MYVFQLVGALNNERRMAAQGYTGEFRCRKCGTTQRHTLRKIAMRGDEVLEDCCAAPDLEALKRSVGGEA